MLGPWTRADRPRSPIVYESTAAKSSSNRPSLGITLRCDHSTNHMNNHERQRVASGKAGKYSYTLGFDQYSQNFRRLSSSKNVVFATEISKMFESWKCLLGFKWLSGFETLIAHTCKGSSNNPFELTNPEEFHFKPLGASRSTENTDFFTNRSRPSRRAIAPLSVLLFSVTTPRATWIITSTSEWSLARPEKYSYTLGFNQYNQNFRFLNSIKNLVFATEISKNVESWKSLLGLK